MKKTILIIGITLLSLILTGCGNGTTKQEEKESKIISYEGLEFLNTGIDNQTIKTTVINNTDYSISKVKFSIKIMDKDGNVLVIEEDEISSMKTGTTKKIETKTDKNIDNASSIEYSIVQK